MGALLAGGVIAAPVGAWLVHRVPAARVLGAGVGGLVILTNARVLVETLGIPAPWPVLTYLAVAVAWAAAVAVAVRPMRRDYAAARA